MTFELRDYQQDMIAHARGALRVHRSILLQGPTGMGKTALCAHMIGSAKRKNKRAYFICHREELIIQTSDTFDSVEVDHGFIAARFTPSPHQSVQICSINTLKNRLNKVPEPDLVVWDEAHHCKAAGWKKVKEAWPNAMHVGLTATPERLDGKGLDDLFDYMVLGPTVASLIERGYLCDYKAFAPSAPDMTGIHTRMGDYAKDEIENLMDNNTIIGDAVRNYEKFARGKRAVAFCVSVKHSMHVAAQFSANGHRAVHLDGQTSPNERRHIIQSFRDGDVDVLCNVDIIGEGFDLPAIEASILLRPTQSLSLYLQQVGRALRPSDGKSHAIILDHTGNVMRHGLPDEDREWKLEGKPKRRGKKNDEQNVAVRQCTECFACHPPAPKCPECGHVYEVVGRQLNEKDGELKEVDKKEMMRQRRKEQGECRTLDDLVAHARKLKYKHPERWAAHIMTARRRKGR